MVLFPFGSEELDASRSTVGVWGVPALLAQNVSGPVDRDINILWPHRPHGPVCDYPKNPTVQCWQTNDIIVVSKCPWARLCSQCCTTGVRMVSHLDTTLQLTYECDKRRKSAERSNRREKRPRWCKSKAHTLDSESWNVFLRGERER